MCVCVFENCARKKTHSISSKSHYLSIKSYAWKWRVSRKKEWEKWKTKILQNSYDPFLKLTTWKKWRIIESSLLTTRSKKKQKKRKTTEKKCQWDTWDSPEMISIIIMIIQYYEYINGPCQTEQISIRFFRPFRMNKNGWCWNGSIFFRILFLHLQQQRRQQQQKKTVKCKFVSFFPDLSIFFFIFW